MGEGGATVILQWPEQWIGVDLVARGREKSAAIIAAQVVTMRGDRAGVVEDILARSSSVQNRVSDRQRRAAGDAVVVDAAEEAGRIAAQGAITDHQHRAALAAVVVDAAAVADGEVAEDATVAHC